METKKTNCFEPYNEFQTKGRQKVTGIHITGWKRKCGLSLLEQYANATNGRGALFRQASIEARTVSYTHLDVYKRQPSRPSNIPPTKEYSTGSMTPGPTAGCLLYTSVARTAPE